MRSLFCLALGAGLLLPAAARADFIITGVDANVVAGHTGTVDFTIASTNPTVDALASFSIELQITTTHGTSFLQFTGSQPDFSNVSGPPPYVFAGNSGAGASYWALPTSTVTANDTIAGGDWTNDGGFVPLTQSYLLARVRFQTDPHAALGDRYQIALVSDPNQTYFVDGNGNNVAFTSSAATVEIVAGSFTSTPAPPSVVLLGVAAATGVVYRRRGRRTALDPDEAVPPQGSDLLLKSEPGFSPTSCQGD